ncbi:unnamed protein product (macronuclear) [Paramecium tetraurelia]|uniref:Uncharacterized protein n=1 Tax=Paramecium tetraurelia TaxID=5888 RepID=A0BRB8_PARTE|nr:uncharacterized protein GSPATT00031316001 [Paramecium tetraurelia]CAK61085.1 unnamed protein product [Paramecium tetraurelia]|eukprot:XP_001428483.1 hypothetical protein (macronuclear) [Paramecium tetraurelia strain d4-2]
MAQDFCKQYQNVNIRVGYNRFEIPNFTKLIYLEIESYTDLFNVDQVFQQEIQDRASKILRLNNWDKEHFQKFICKLPLITNSNIKFKDCEMGIKLKNSFHQNKTFRNEVNKLLESLKYSQIYLKVDAKLSKHLELIGIQQKKHVLTNLLMDFTQQKNILYIKDIQIQYIELVVYFNEFIEIDLIQLENYLNETLSKLEIARLTTEEFQSKYSALLYVQNQQLYFILHSDYLNKIKTLLESYKTLIYLYYKPKSKLYAQKIFYDYKNKIMEQSSKVLSITLSSNQEIVYFESPSYDMTTLCIFRKYEQKLDQLLLEIPIKISRLEANFLYKNCQQELEKLCQQQMLELSFNLTKNQQEINQQTTKIQFMKFKKKEVYFDTNLQCEISLRWKNKQNQDLKISYKKQDQIRSSMMDIQENMVPNIDRLELYTKEMKDNFVDLLSEFMQLHQTRFYELVIFIDNEKLKSKYEKELVNQISILKYDRYADAQWKWYNNAYFDEYNFITNEQIETAYQIYLIDNKKNELLLKFPYNDKPRTHTIDLKKGKITDHSSTQTQEITLKDGFITSVKSKQTIF